VQVHVNHIEAHVARLHLAENRVQVRAVVIQQSARIVHRLVYLLDVLLEHTKRGRVGKHEAGGVRADRALSSSRLMSPLASVGISRHRVAAHHRGRRVGACAASGTRISVRAVSPRASW